MKQKLLGTLAVIGTTACGQPPGEMTSGGYADLPADVQTELTESNVDFILEKGTDVHVGSSPPDITGTYLLDSFDVVNSSYSSENKEQGYLLRFEVDPASGKLTFEMSDLDPSPINEIYRSNDVVVTGSGNSFTAYAGFLTSDPEQPSASTLHVFSGTVGEDGLARLSAFACGYSEEFKFEGDIDVTGPDGSTRGGFRVSEETDGLAARQAK